MVGTRLQSSQSSTTADAVNSQQPPAQSSQSIKSEINPSNSQPIMHSMGFSVQPLKLEGNLMANWKFWIQSFTIFLKACGYDKENDDRKVNLLLHLIGEIYNSFNYSNEDNIVYNELVKKFEDYFVPKQNITVERHKFFTRIQGSSESLDDYITDLINKVTIVVSEISGKV